MIFGRPPNLILAAFTAVFNVFILTLASLNPPITIDVGVVSAVNIAAAAVIALVANTPPTLNPGDKYNVTAPAGVDNVTRTVPPVAERPPSERSTD